MKTPEEKTIIIDWVSFTVKEQSPIKVIIEILQMNIKLFSPLKSGKMGYKKQLHYENIYILYDGTEEMGVHVIMSGKGCAEFEIKESILELFERLNKIKSKCTRIDLALDDKVGDLIPIDNIIEDITGGNSISKWRTNLETTKRDMKGNILGKMITVGLRTSDTFLRIYDKSLEQKVDGTWNRIELEIKKNNAVSLQKMLTEENAGEIFQGILKNYIRIVEPNKKEKNRSRLKNKSYWENIVQTASKIKLTKQKKEKTIDEKKSWLENQVGQTMAMVSLHDGDVNFIYELITKNAKSLKTKNKELLRQYQIFEEEELKC